MLFPRVTVVFLAIILFWCLPVFAEVETIYATHKYVMGDNDSKSNARRMCFFEAKRRVLEKAGTYIESFTEVKNAQLTKDEISVYSASLLKVDIVKEKWELVEENLAILLTVKAQVDTSYMKQKFSEFANNKSLRKKIEKQQNNIKQLQLKFSKLEKQMHKVDTKVSLSLQLKQSGLLEPFVKLYQNMDKLAILSDRAFLEGDGFDGKSFKKPPEDLSEKIDMLKTSIDWTYEKHNSEVWLILTIPFLREKYKSLFITMRKKQLKPIMKQMRLQHLEASVLYSETRYVKVRALAKEFLEMLESSFVAFEGCFQALNRIENSVIKPQKSG